MGKENKNSGEAGRKEAQIILPLEENKGAGPSYIGRGFPRWLKEKLTGVLGPRSSFLLATKKRPSIHKEASSEDRSRKKSPKTMFGR